MNVSLPVLIAVPLVLCPAPAFADVFGNEGLQIDAAARAAGEDSESWSVEQDDERERVSE